MNKVFAPCRRNVYDFWALQKLHFAVSLEVLKEAPKSNKHQGSPLGSWPEAPVCSWE